MHFGAWLKLLRQAQGRGGMALIPLPVTPMLWACDLTRLIPGLPTVSRERVLGLARATAMEAGDSLRELGLAPGDPRMMLEQEARR